MNFIVNIIEPNRLIVTWQPHKSITCNRIRRSVGIIEKCDGEYLFRYSYDSIDFKHARDEGMELFRPFSSPEKIYDKNVIEFFSARLPPRNRNDFNRYLESIRIKSGVKISNFALLGYSEGRLPSDGYAFLHPFDDATPNFEVLLEVSGHRFYENRSFLNIGDDLDLKPDKDNIYDSNALAFFKNNTIVGYVNRFLTSAVYKWLYLYNIKINVEKVSKFSEINRIYAFIKVSNKP